MFCILDAAYDVHFNTHSQMMNGKILMKSDILLYIHVCAKQALCEIMISGGSRNFKTGGGGAVEFLGLGFVLMPLHIYPMCL